MILDRLADLKTLAERASMAASASTEDAALADVHGQVAKARSLFVGLGVARARTLSMLTDAERQSVLEAASRLRHALEVVSNATDEELAAYASATPDKRGSLLAIQRQAAGLRAGLIGAQQALLGRLADGVWPRDQLLQLDVISHLSDNAAAADTARRIERIHERLTERALVADVGLEASELEALIEEANRAARDAGQLGTEEIPDDLLAFWRDASSEIGASLDELAPSVREWLQSHNALGAFTIHRSR